MMLARMGQRVREALWGRFYRGEEPPAPQTQSHARRRLARGSVMELRSDEAGDSIEKALQRYLDARRGVGEDR